MNIKSRSDQEIKLGWIVLDSFVEDVIRVAKNLDRKISILCISTGSGWYDYHICKALTKADVKFSLVATDIVDCAVDLSDKKFLTDNFNWSFLKVIPEARLPFRNSSFDIVYHTDVIEHVNKPFLFSSECYRVLKWGGYMIFSTPNLFRISNIIRLILGKLSFPRTQGFSALKAVGMEYHIKEYSNFDLKLLFTEVGFTKFIVKYIYFGIHFLDLAFSYLPKSRFCKFFSHYLIVSVCKLKQ